MPMIGANLNDLDRTSSDMGAFAATAETSGTTVVTTTRRAVGNIEAETNTAESTIIDALESMQTGMTTANTTLQGAEYVGGNADLARDTGSDMERRVAQAVAEVTDAFTDFRTRLTALGTELDGIAPQFDAYAVKASASGESFSQAMRNQSTNLDQVMNQGLTIG